MATPEPISIADVIPLVLDRARARAEDELRVAVDPAVVPDPVSVSASPPTQPAAHARDARTGGWAGGRGGGGGGGGGEAHLAVETKGPMARGELARLGRSLPDWHSGSTAVAHRLAQFLPRAEVVKMLLEAQASESARRPTAVFVASLGAAVDPAKGADAEEWIRDHSQVVPSAVTERYLETFVHEPAERARLADLVAQLPTQA